MLHSARQSLTGVSDSAWLEAEILLCHCLEKPRSYLRAWPERSLTRHQHACFADAVQQRQSGKPIAYITGHREFWSREFFIDDQVLIPRPETELLVELALNALPEQSGVKILDLGTGSGAIAVTLAAERPDADVTAVDISLGALDTARKNAEKFNLNNIRFNVSDWFDNIESEDFALIISNPPYLAVDDPHLHQGDLRFEPPTALISAGEGLTDLSTIIAHARKHLRNNGWLLVEHGYNQQQAVQGQFRRYGYHDIQTYEDLSAIPRVTVGRWDT